MKYLNKWFGARQEEAVLLVKILLLLQQFEQKKKNGELNTMVTEEWKSRQI